MPEETLTSKGERTAEAPQAGGGTPSWVAARLIAVRNEASFLAFLFISFLICLGLEKTLFPGRLQRLFYWNNRENWVIEVKKYHNKRYFSREADGIFVS
jgi:hypothetical protein